VEQAAVLSPEEPDKAAFSEQPKSEEGQCASALASNEAPRPKQPVFDFTPPEDDSPIDMVVFNPDLLAG
jgi:hypothetical protein